MILVKHAQSLIASTFIMLGLTANQTALAGITIVDSGAMFHNGAGTTTISNIVVSGSPNLLIVGVAGKTSNDSVTGSWGGTSLGSPVIDENYSGTWSQIFVCSNLTENTEDLSVTVPNATGGESYGVAILSLSAPGAVGIEIDSQGTNSSAGPLTITFSTAVTSSDFVFGVAGANGNTSNPATTNLTTNLISADDGGYPSFAITADYANSINGASVTWTASTTRFSAGAIKIHAVPPTGTVILVK